MASAPYLVIADSLFRDDLDAQARVLQGLITGIGFVGAGATLEVKSEEAVRGSATAASVWATGALGAAMAYGQLHIALLLAGIVSAILRWMTPLEEALEQDGAGDEEGERSEPAG